MPKNPVNADLWETESGLPNDIDAWVKGPYFGQKEEYKEVAGDAVLLILPLVDGSGEELRGPAYSIGGGWVPKDGGKRVEHPTRQRFVKTSMVGRLIDRVVKELKVPMHELGAPTSAGVWDGIGFHWMQEEHTTVSGEKRTQLMPVAYLGTKEAPAQGVVKAKGLEIAKEVEEKLAELAKKGEYNQFVKAALKIKEVVTNDPLLSHITDDSGAGFWATHR